MRCAALLVVAGAGGCSFAFTASPGTVSRDELPACTTSHAPVIADAIGSVPPFVLAGLMTYFVLAGQSDDHGHVEIEIGASAFAIGVGFALAAIYGEHNIGACNDAIDDAMLLLARDAEAGNCDHVIALAKRLAHRDVAAALAFVHDATFARCFN